MKRGLNFFVIFLAILMILPLTPLAYGDTAAAGGITINARVGFDKFYKLGYAVPIYFEIENKLRDINGELQVEVPNEAQNVVIYSMNVSLPNNTTKKITMNVPISSFGSSLTINIAEGKNIVTTKKLKIDPGSSMDMLVIGILSDDFESVKYINKIPVNNTGNFSTKVVKLDENSFSEDLEVMKAFNAIVINNFDTSKLGKEKYETLKKWVADGGILLIGTGPSYNKTLAVFKDDFLTGQTGAVQTISTSAPASLLQGSGGAPMSISTLGMELKNSTPVLREGELTLVQRLEKGKGVIGLAAFDFGMAPLSGWAGNSAFAEKLMGRLTPSMYSSPYIQKDIAMRDNMYAVEGSLRMIPELPMPSNSYLMIIFTIYILLAGPISYFILKKLDRRGLMWVTIPVLSLIFAGVIYATGMGTRITGPVANVVSLVDIDGGGNISAKTYAGIFSPNKSNMKVEAAEGMSVRPMLLNMGYDMYRSSSPAGTAQKNILCKVTLSPKTAVEFYRNGVWAMKTIGLETKVPNTGSFVAKLSYKNNALTGTLKNISGFDLNECYIITPNQFVSVGAIKNGETKNINLKLSSYFGNRYDLMNAIYADPYANQGQGGGPKRLTMDQVKAARGAQQKRQVLDFFLAGDSGNPVKLIGWSNTPVAKDILINGKAAKKVEKSFITTPIQLSFTDGKSMEYPMGFVKPIIINNMAQGGSYDEFGKTFYGKGTFEVHFQLDKTMKPEDIKLQYSIGGNNVKQYIWNTQKNDWEEGNYRKFNISGDSLTKYVDQNNMLKLKFEMNDDNVQLPQISVKGSVK